MRMFWTAMVVVTTFALSQTANAADFQTLTVQDVAAIVTEAGGTDVRVNESKDLSFVNFKLGEVTYSFSLRLCSKDDKSKCGGLLMGVGYKMSETDTLELFNNFNRSVPFLTAVKLDNNLMAFGRFVVTLGGVDRENIKTNIALLLLGPELLAEVQKAQVVASVGGNPALLSQMRYQPLRLQPVALTPEQIARLSDDRLIARFRLPR